MKTKKEGDALSEEELLAIFEAKCKDFDLRPTEKLYTRFKKTRGDKARLKVFEMENNSLGPYSAQILTNIAFVHQNFKILCFGGNNFGDKGALAFSELIKATKSVISLDLSSNSFTDVGFQIIFNAMSYNTSIVDLNVGSSNGITRNKIGPLGIKQLSILLSKNRILASLDLSMTELSSENITPLAESLSKNHTLGTLNLSNNNVRSKGTAILLSNLKSSSIVDLILSNNHLTDEISPHVSSFITESSTLKKLDLSSNNLTQRFTTSLSVPLSKPTCHLQELNLSRNAIGGRGISSLGHGIQSNTSLHRLDVSACKIQQAGFIEFCDQFINNEFLVSLTIHHNPIRDDGVTSLAHVIEKHPSLKELDLELCEISDKGCTELFKAASKSPSLVKISVKNNLIRDGLSIQKAVMENSKLLNVNIEYNDIEFNVYSEIQRNLQNNKKLRILAVQPKADDAAQVVHFDTELADVRSDIRLERILIEDLKEQLAQKKQEEQEAIDSSNKTTQRLETKLDEVAQTVNDALYELRNQREQLQKRKQDVELEVTNLSNRLARESEDYRLDVRNFNNLSKKIEQLEEAQEKEMKDLEDKLKDAKLLYADNRRLLETAFQFAKMKPEVEVEVPDSNETEKDNDKKKKKGKSKSKAKNKEKTKNQYQEKVQDKSTEKVQDKSAEKDHDKSTEKDHDTDEDASKEKPKAKSKAKAKKESTSQKTTAAKKSENSKGAASNKKSKKSEPLENAPAAASGLEDSGVQPS